VRLDIGRLRALANRLEFRFARSGTGTMPGAHRSRARGHGGEFAEHREYQYGDDIRTVDWNVTARRGRCFVKEHERPRASAAAIVLDASASMSSPDLAKWQLARDVSALVGVMAAREGDAIGAYRVALESLEELPMRRGVAHALVLARWLDEAPDPAGGTGIGAGVRRARTRLRPGGLLIVVSDFLDPDWDAELRRAAARHLVLGIRIVSTRERTLASAGLVQVRDAESAEIRWLDSGAAPVRRSFAAQAARTSHAIRRRVLDAGALHAEVETGGSWWTGLRPICEARGR
jgi:uncharacterized protein (DUF58 family)